MRSLLILSCAVLLSGCANPLNRVTSDRYAETCSAAERDNRLDVAEQACYRSLINVDIGNLGPEYKSNRLYNLGRIKRQLSKFSEAEDLFRQSLSIEEKLSSPTDLKIGRRLFELSIVLAAQEKWSEGNPFLERAIPALGQFVGRDRASAAEVFSEYGKYFRKTNQPQLAERFESQAAALK
jgi:hypothetical protein